jgi:hypothetical protein
MEHVVAQLIQEISFMVSEVSLPCSPEPASELCPKTVECSPHPLNLFLQDSFSCYPGSLK